MVAFKHFVVAIISELLKRSRSYSAWDFPLPSKIHFTAPLPPLDDNRLYQIRCLCNPNGILSYEQIQSLEPSLTTIRGEGNCSTSRCGSRFKFDVSIAVVQSIHPKECPKMRIQTKLKSSPNAKPHPSLTNLGSMYTDDLYHRFALFCPTSILLLCSNQVCFANRGLQRARVFLTWRPGLHYNYTSYLEPLRKTLANLEYFRCNELLIKSLELLNKDLRTAAKKGPKMPIYQIPLWALLVFGGTFFLSVVLFAIGVYVNRSADVRMMRKGGNYMTTANRRWGAGFGGGLYGAGGAGGEKSGGSMPRASIFRYGSRQQRSSTKATNANRYV